jgi:hypothetical protein
MDHRLRIPALEDLIGQKLSRGSAVVEDGLKINGRLPASIALFARIRSGLGIGHFQRFANEYSLSATTFAVSGECRSHSDHVATSEDRAGIYLLISVIDFDGEF